MRRHGGLGIAFVAVHLWLFWEIQHAPNDPLYDVTQVYAPWVRDGLAHGHWVGIQSAWVYPIGALVPMVLAAVLGFHAYEVVWLALVTLLNGLACVYLGRSGARGRASAYWWLLFLAALGPIALGRIDSLAAPLAIGALLLLDRRPNVAAGLLTFAACIKVWPVALLVTMLIASKARPRILASSAVVGSLVFGIPMILGASLHHLVSFFSMQSGRGLQLEAPLTTPWLWVKGAGFHNTAIVWHGDIKTFEVAGVGTSLLAQALTPMMVVIFLGVCALGIRASRAGVPTAAYLGPLGLALTATLIVTNKVGSPQFGTWIAAPIVLGLLLQNRGGPSFRTAAVIGIVIAGLTQYLYPWGYDGLVATRLPHLIAITLRNGLLIALLGIGIRQLAQVVLPESPDVSAQALDRDPELQPAGE